jgi:hypothetical protein
VRWRLQCVRSEARTEAHLHCRVKKDDILQGKTQSLVGCEPLCDVEQLSVT